MEPPRKTSVQNRLDIKTAEARITSVGAQEITQQNSKGSTLDEPEELGDVSYVDIQWLQGKVSVNGVNGKSPSRDHHPVKLELPQTAKVSKKPEISPVPLMSLGCTLPKASIVSKSPEEPVSPQVQISLPVPLMSTDNPDPPLNKPRSRLKRLSNQTVVFKSHVKELETLVADLSLGEAVYKFVERRPSQGQPVYTAKLKIGDALPPFSSYPEETATKEEAKEIVSRIAVDHISKIHAIPVGMETVDESLIEERVFHLIENKSNGIFDQAIGEEYKSVFKAPLPSTWLSIIEKSPRFSVSKSDILGSKAIVYPVPKDAEVIEEKLVSSSRIDGNTRPTETSATASGAVASPTSTMNGDAVCVPSPMSNGFHRKKSIVDINANRVEPSTSETASRKLPELVLPTENTWDVFVASSYGNEIWVRLIGEEYDERYNNVMTDMELRMYSKKPQTALNPQIDEYFAVLSDNCWIRVQLKELMQDSGECLVFLIDNGEMDTVLLSDLKILENDFLDLPPQAVPCKLSYLDISYEEAQAYLLSQVIGNSFVAEILEPPTENSCAHVVLYNTEGEDPVNINYEILNRIVLKLEPPTLPQKDKICPVKITHVDKETPPFVQVQGKDLTFLETILNDISKLDLIALYGVNAHPKLDNKRDKFVLARSKQDKERWRRGVVVTDDARSCMIRFVDYGYAEKVMRSDIFDLSQVLPGLTRFPAQAVQVNLYDLDPSRINEGIIRRLRKLAPPNVFVIGKRKMDAGSGDQLPSLELFKKILPDNIICSINSDISFNYDEYSETVEDSSSQIDSVPKGSSGSCHPLPRYPLPSGSDFFDVYVCLSISPSNFVVQPVQELNSSFRDMMEDLQRSYESKQDITLFPGVDDLVECATFAAKRPEDNVWYRVTIDSVIGESMVSVKYSDFGDVGLLPVNQLRYLDAQYREIPALAIKCKLHGVKPLNVEWSAEECLFFNDLVLNKPMVSKIMGTCEESGRALLQLIDVQHADDIYIADTLVEEKMAVHA